MMRGSARGFLGVLTLVEPPAALEAVTFSAARHELPDAASAGARNGQRMETGFGLRKINEVLRHAFLLERAANHLVVLAGARQSALDRSTAAIREVVDVACDLIGHHQGQVGTRGLNLGFGFGLYVLVDGWSGFIGLVNWRGLGRLLGETVALLKSRQFEIVSAVENAVEFGFETVVRLEIESAAEELIEGGDEVLLGGFVRSE